MSQNKTIVPGVDYNNYDTGDADSVYGSLYSRSGDDSQRTYVPGVNKQPSPTPTKGSVISSIPQTASPQINGRQLVLQERVVVGVLFSISRGLLGEIFPLYLGKNIIGQSVNCDITLNEKNVSNEHAILHIRKNGNLYESSITDFNSTYGTRVNDIDARYDTVPVKENDILVIGNHYKFIVKFFEVERYGLTEEEDFEDSCSNPVSLSMDNTVSADVNFYKPTSKEDGDSSRTVIY